MIIDMATNWGGSNTGLRRIELRGTTGGVDPTITYQYTTDASATTYNGAELTIAQLQGVTNTKHQNEKFQVKIDGDVGAMYTEFSIDNYVPDLTPPSVPTITNLEETGSGSNFGLFSDWTEPTEIDFDRVTGQINIDAGGWQDIDNTGGIGGGTPMKFNESLAGTQTQEAGWLYQNHWARNGYASGQTAQVRFRSYDDSENNSAYSTSSLLTFGSGSAPGAPAISSAASGDGQVTLTFAADSETDVIYARYRLASGGNWSAESETFKRTGSGTITITGLTNNLKDGYWFTGYAKSATVTSDWAQPVQGWATNDDFLAAREATRQRIRDDAAYAQLKIAQKLGVLVTFSNPGASDVNLYALVDSPSTKNVNVRGNAVRYSEVVFSIPRQTSFPPAAIHPSATITLNSKSYQVEQVEYEAEDISQAESVRLICGVISEQDCY